MCTLAPVSSFHACRQQLLTLCCVLLVHPTGIWVQGPHLPLTAHRLCALYASQIVADGATKRFKQSANFPLASNTDVANMATYLSALPVGDVVAISARDVPIIRVELLSEDFTSGGCSNDPTMRILCDPGRGLMQAIPKTSYVLGDGATGIHPPWGGGGV